VRYVECCTGLFVCGLEVCAHLFVGGLYVAEVRFGGLRCWGLCVFVISVQPLHTHTHTHALPIISFFTVQKTICCNSTSNAPDDGRIRPKHVELRIYQ
jgi:hypothetical protein